MNIESNDIIDIATAYREAGMHNRIAEPIDDVWISAINEASSTLVSKPFDYTLKYKERILQAWENLESKQFTVGRPKIREVARGQRDPITGQEIVKCSAKCSNVQCVVGRGALHAVGWPIEELHCSNCLECTLEALGGNE